MIDLTYKPDEVPQKNGEMASRKEEGKILKNGDRKKPFISRTGRNVFYGFVRKKFNLN